MTALLVDSSVLIDFVRGADTPVADALERAIRANVPIVIGDLVLVEVLQGIRHPRHLREVERSLASFEARPVGGVERARSAAANYRVLRAAGFTPRSPIDVLLATFCIEENLNLLANDRDFRFMVPVLGLSLVEPSFH